MLVAVAVSFLPVGNPPASARRSDDGASLSQMQRERERVRREKASKAGQVDVLRATDAEVADALAALSANVSAEKDRLEEAQRAVARAKAEQTAAEEAQAAKQRELDALTEQMKRSAVEAYVRMGSSSDALSTLGEEDVNDAVKKRTLLSMRANENIDLAERFRSVQEDLEVERARAEEAGRRATEQQAAVESRVKELDRAYQQQQAFAAQVEQRLESALAEAQALESLDAGLSQRISSRQAEIAKAAQRAAEAARRAQASQASRSSSGGGSSRGGGGAPPPIAGSGEIVSVGGIRVHRSIAGNVQALLSAAAADGIHLSGGGFRDPAGQISVRRNNCGTSHYAIYEMPASSCRPPTARPGMSMHERGLAIDFTQGGSTLNRSSSGFHWLKANASRYGLYNLPSEPWHWSTNGN